MNVLIDLALIASPFLVLRLAFRSTPEEKARQRYLQGQQRTKGRVM